MTGVFGTGALACDGIDGALQPAGRDAERIASLFWWMTGGGTLVWIAVVGLAMYALLAKNRAHDRRKMQLFVVWGGAVVPAVLITTLLIFGLRMMPDLLETGPEDGIHVRVTGERWWWRVHYELPDGSSFESANELRLPVGQRVTLRLDASEVVHSFWVPALGGKIDMIPGRTNQMALEPTRTGVFHGFCAEYCGIAHAHMLFDVVVLTGAEFDAWTLREREPAPPVATETAQRGEALFASLGCGACHTVRGTDARGATGPDLTHFGSRKRVGAGVLSNDIEGLSLWLGETDHVKPGVLMPSFRMLADTDRRALAAYLKELQ